MAHEMIEEDQQVLFSRDFRTAIHSPVITTGNELSGDEIAEFSRQLDVRELYRYAQEVMRSTERMLTSLEYPDLKRKFGEDMIEKLKCTGCVSNAENAAWLKGIDPIACCGFSCNHCFLGEWCGSCRTAYNTCSFATVSPDGKCPNTVCCQEKGIDGCYECSLLETCEKGFYTPANDGANAAKAQAMYIRKHGKKEFLKVHDRLHEKYNFARTQEILGQDCQEGLRILEES